MKSLHCESAYRVSHPADNVQYAVFMHDEPAVRLSDAVCYLQWSSKCSRMQARQDHVTRTTVKNAALQLSCTKDNKPLCWPTFPFHSWRSDVNPLVIFIPFVKQTVSIAPSGAYSPVLFSWTKTRTKDVQKNEKWIKIKKIADELNKNENENSKPN